MLQFSFFFSYCCYMVFVVLERHCLSDDGGPPTSLLIFGRDFDP